MVYQDKSEPANYPRLYSITHIYHEATGEAVRRHRLYCCVRKLPEIVVGYPSYSGGTTNNE
jgi:hypothetical protein